ncbi:MAG: glycosyltransferase [Bacteroidales bacterium]|nr:glycosyltransferase [Bacteroidales bacterium]
MDYFNYLLTTTNNFEKIILVLFGISLLTQLIYYFFIYSRIIFYKKKESSGIDNPVSVVICARNEVENLAKHLPLILTQDYPDYEVIVVNDCSSDKSEETLAVLQTKYHNLRVTTINEDKKFHHGKKLALTIGIKAAKNEILLLIDADCYPADKKWIRQMQKNFTDKTEIVLGYGGYVNKKGFVNKLIRFDTFFIALQYFGLAIAGKPYMGVGRNLAYRKSTFFKNKGFSGHNHILSGDDDLFINSVANKKNVKIEIDKTSHTRSLPKNSLKEWFTQKRRHLTTSKYYKTESKFILGLEILSREIFYLSFILLLILKFDYRIILIVFLFRLLLQSIIIKKGMNRLQEKSFLFLVTLFDILLPIFNFCLIISNYFIIKQNKWK